MGKHDNKIKDTLGKMPRINRNRQSAFCLSCGKGRKNNEMTKSQFAVFLFPKKFSRLYFKFIQFIITIYA